MRKLTLLTLTILSTLFACKQSTSINAEDAGEKISAYLETHPEAKSEKFKFGEVKFNSKSEMEQLTEYRRLADSGYVAMTMIEAKKKFLSSDSAFTYNIRLTEKSKPYVIEQKSDKAEVRVILYQFAGEKPVDFSIVNDNNAKATVSLKKIATPFYFLMSKDKGNSDFITKTYKLRFEKDKGWAVR